jgi:tetratricopeptide (TPR) repeat protein
MQEYKTRCTIQSQIRKSGSAHSFPSYANAYIAVNEVYWIVPFVRNQQFVGRDFCLNQLESALFTEHQPAKFAITGLGGIGKTQIALELAYRAKEKHQDCSVFWVPATNSESLQQAFMDIGQQLKILSFEDKQADVKKLVQRHLSQQSIGQWLFIIDNVDDIDMWNKELKAYLPKSQRGCVVCTTRNRKVAFKIAATPNVIKVPEMDEEMAMQLLGKSLADQEFLASRQDALKLLEQLTFLPLAIVQAAAYINANGIVLSEYLLLLEEQEQDVVELLSEDFEDDGRYEDSKNPIATTWLISFEHIRRIDPLAAEYLSFMSCVDPKDIPQSLLPPAQSRKKETDALGTLDAYSFISKRAVAEALDMHRLVHLAMRNWLRREGLLAEWGAKTMRRLEEVFPENDHRNRRIWRLYLAHAQYVLGRESPKDDEESRIELTRKFANCLYSDGRYNETEPWYVRMMERSKRVLGEEHPDTLASIHHLAIIYSDQGRWKEAGELQRAVMESAIRLLGVNHFNTLTSMANLASTFWNQGRWKEAEELEVQVMETRKRVLGEEHPETLTSMGNLASTYRNQGRWKEADELEVQVMETRKRVLGEEHPETLTSMGNLASTYRNQGRWKEAEELFVQVIETSSRVLGEEHPNTLTSMANLASTCWNQGRWKEAEELNVQVMETRKRVLGEEHPETLVSMGNLASTFWNQGRWKEAEELFVQVIETSSRVLGEEHPKTLTIMGNLAFTLKSQNRDEEALSEIEACFQLRKQVLGEQHAYTISSLNTLNKWQAGNSGKDL